MNKVAVFGAGIMGNGIAQVSAQAGFQVVMRDLEDKFIRSGFEAIKQSLGRMTKGGKITEDEANTILGRIKGTTDLAEASRDADLVIEAIHENLELKQHLFKEIDALCPAHTVLATNTSTIRITAIASATQRPDKVVGMHFSNPVPVMKGVELIRGLQTSEATMETIKKVSTMMGKEYYISKDSPGFIGNRLFPLFVNEAFNVLWEGVATAEDIDKGVKLGLNHPMGPLELADLVGLDQLIKGLEFLSNELGDRYRPSLLMKQLVAAGHYGRKTGRGVYDYSGSDKKKKG
ncbi:MAG: 3-hydroxybutyryl-CoA dehydrogenase [Deltaproteobacteria bacterium]|nr:MAG: 3-hydroxybutyryl-CoA dehydrogenase [Deltaproteobacteria bacterium]